MKQMNILILMAIMVSHTYAAPQFITFKDGKLGVNFGGYHAGVGMTGLLGGGTGGGLFAEAGTPHGQSARAGLAGGVDEKGGATGGLFAGATAGGNVKAAAGLGGGVGEDKASGSGFASAQAGNSYATSSMGGVASDDGSNGFLISENGSEVSVLPIEITKPDTTNEIRPTADVDVNEEKDNVQPAVTEKVVIEEPKPKLVDKYYTKKHNKPHRHHLRKTYITEYVEPAPGVKSDQTVEKRIDIITENQEAPVVGEIDQKNESTDQVTYTKDVTVGRNPNFFQDIFNIPISTLKAVSDLLSGVAKDTSVSLEKSASVEGETDAISLKHDPSSVHQSSEAHISVQTPSASKIIDGIFAIPINTLGAVNKFLENNVSGRKRIQVTQESSGEPTKVRLGPHARRRANKHVVVVEQEEKHEE